ncbi:DUF1080 domain-containing protein [Blastopirellula sp. J2-11]|uniref:PVC-type heme-binding CxxCH protein n=1 Tax=Blastopirellula sp. J2-11 TaxID=2943192 RepID=UPI0021C5F34E|nr:PVC-type heme-binding CxxCH protein [Blastopirellula sp. J2-11]UUO06385.1 DUF1080 domain-containing protein [Blastopirellula sp. J2-11]
MKKLPGLLLLAAIFATPMFLSIAHAEEGFKSIFDGKTLNGWRGKEQFWSVQDGAITGQTTAENPTKGNTFLIWDQGKVDDFELKLKYKIIGGNSGIQYRSTDLGDFVVKGYQADIDSKDTYSGINYEERGRGIIANRGVKATIYDDNKGNKNERFAESADIQAKINKEDWNEYHIVAKGNHLTHYINGVKTSEVIDEGKKDNRESGILALQLHAGPPMIVQFKEIELKRTKLENGKKKVVFVPGMPSHGWGQHEHTGGSRLLMLALTENVPGFQGAIYPGGWPEDPTAFDNADAVVVFCDGGGRHLLNAHLAEFDKLMKDGVGLACLHYGVEVPKGEPGAKFLDWIGGYFETDWSVNPHWTADFKTFPDHPIANGVKPFSINDEWYYNMRFRNDMDGVTPILSAVPPKSTLDRPDGPHSGNPHVRAMIGQPQHVAWAAQRPDGGRGFGFTGGHFHSNWGNDDFRKVVLNAIVWVSGEEVPATGVESKSLTQDDLEGLIGPNPNAAKKKINKAQVETAKADETADKAKYQSKVVTTRTPGHSVNIDVDITGAKQLYLVVTDGGDGFSCDWADWVEPRLIGPAGEKKLTELEWKSATSQWRSVNRNRNVDGSPMRVNGQPVENGIGTHANSIIAYDLPEGYTRFQAKGALDNGGSDQQGGKVSSVSFSVYTTKPSAKALNVISDGGTTREPEDAIQGLDVYDGLEATLAASEPTLKSLTNLDVDHRGRVWVCDVMNYRRNNDSRPEGDRILILEDEDGDGVCEKSKVYYQGRDVDSAMGICVLGNKVIVSAAPNIIVFTDTDGDDKPDQKELLFTKTGQPQHDHSAHSFLFGPDGKLYWNVGNTGKQVFDKDGQPVVDIHGREVVDNGQPFFGGMPFRCNLDGSEFEVLAHNFRNNYEVSVDSFGTLWQSDNDDDGNRGVRINYVMEQGNYGYKDQMNGSSWRTPRTGMSDEIPLRHWHLNDPGVVPNFLQTGAGSPTGICVYEGRLLPKVFWDQVIHCDAGPNIVRAYPAQDDGAGYQGEIVDILFGARDNWFRPADVCVAPDGSLFVSDWYDPGVGGHGQRDLDRGRLFRIAPQGEGYHAPKYDFDTIDGALAALENPNLSVRYMAWTSLHNQGAKAEAGLRKMFETNANPRIRARALWLLGKIQGRGQHYVAQALADKDSNIRITGLRLAKQLKLPIEPLVAKLVNDPSPQVRREAAISLRWADSPEAAKLWAQLAVQHDGQDRWCLEALGIGADLNWDACLEAYKSQVSGKLDTPAGRDIVWRSRAEPTSSLLSAIIRENSTPYEMLPHYFRAFDFQAKSDAKSQILADLAFSGAGTDAKAKSLILSEAISRLDGFDVTKNPQYATALKSALEELSGSPVFVQLIDKFNVSDRYVDLLAIAQQQPGEEIGVAAMKVLLNKNQRDMVVSAIHDKDLKKAIATAEAVGNSAAGPAMGIMQKLVDDPSMDLSLRRIAVKALAANRGSANKLVALAKSGKLDPALMQAAAAPLTASTWQEVRDQATAIFPAPPSKDNQPLPPLAELVKMRGDAVNGQKLFAGEATCSKCHIVNNQGKEVGPNLSEIGSKLSREATFESILYPSAGISHNFENFAVLLENGTAITGLLVSETDEAITIKNQEGLVRTFSQDEVEEMKKLSISLMPNDLQKLMTVQELVDVTAYLETLKKKN